MSHPQWSPPRGPHGQFPGAPPNPVRPTGNPISPSNPVRPTGPTGSLFGPNHPPVGPPEPVPAAAAGSPRRRRWPLVALVGLVAAVAIVGGIDAGVALTRGPTLNHDAVERSVTDLARTGYGLDLLDVACPSDQPVKPGVSFTCTATTGDGRALTVPITISDTSGRYEVGQPM